MTSEIAIFCIWLPLVAANPHRPQMLDEFNLAQEVTFLRLAPPECGARMAASQRRGLGGYGGSGQLWECLVLMASVVKRRLGSFQDI